MKTINKDDRFKTKVKILCAYLVKAAIDKRCVPYIEAQSVLGVTRAQIGWYAGTIGDYCLERGLPLLNALLIQTQTCQPNEDGFGFYRDERGEDWGTLVSKCWTYFAEPGMRRAAGDHFTGLSKDFDSFFASEDH